MILRLQVCPKIKGKEQYKEESFESIYNEGRKTAIEALPKIKELLGEDFVGENSAFKNKTSVNSKKSKIVQKINA